MTDLQLRYDVDRQVLEARQPGLGPAKHHLEQLGFQFSWLGGPHWRLTGALYDATMEGLQQLGYHPQVQLESQAGWTVLGRDAADGEWEHV